MSTAGFSKTRLGRMHDVMAGYVERREVATMILVEGCQLRLGEPVGARVAEGTRKEEVVAARY